MNPMHNTQTIAWFNQQNQMKNIDLKAKFQRDVVLSPAAQAYLIDTLLRRLPIPKVYLRVLRDEKGNMTYQVVDGKQRLTAIFKFLKDELLLQDKYSKDIGLGGKRFSNLSVDMKTRFFGYDMSVQELHDASSEEIKDMFKRLNRTGAKLNQQELRHAAYEGDFIQLAEEITNDSYWGKVKMFGTPEIRRMTDVEYISELLMMVHEKKIMDRKKGLDRFYADNEVMGNVKKAELKSDFQKTFNIVKKTVLDNSTRFVNKGDFYSLFYAVNYFRLNGYIFDKTNLEKMRETLSVLTTDISARADVKRFADYHNSTQQAVDSYQSRNVRFEVLRDLFEPMMSEKKDVTRNFTLLQKQVIWNKSANVTDQVGKRGKICGICGMVVESFDEYEPDHIKRWTEGGRTEISNGRVTHALCNRSRA
ncbi:MAG: DUF262 domain-containing protein [Chloroflexi bacterium]|nr:DUF262 domain-containing protein [Chloroflexota bacterium]